MLGTLVSIHLFCNVDVNALSEIRTSGVSAGTDNQGNSFIVKKFLTTKWPGAAVLMQLARSLAKRRLWLDLAWVPREENVEADQLSNEDYEGFNPDRRIDVDLSVEKFPVLFEMLELQKAVVQELAQKKAASKGRKFPKLSKRQKFAEKSSW
jgi:hypothetical protein